MPSSPRRFGQVIRLAPGAFEQYAALHRAVWPEVKAALTRSHIHHYVIYERDGWLFAHFEYHGEDFEQDQAALRADPATQRWWQHTDPLQQPLDTAAPGEWWSGMRELFYLP